MSNQWRYKLAYSASDFIITDGSRIIAERIYDEKDAQLMAAALELIEMLNEIANAGQEALDYSDGSGKPILQEAIWRALSLISKVKEVPLRSKEVPIV